MIDGGFFFQYLLADIKYLITFQIKSSSILTLGLPLPSSFTNLGIATDHGKYLPFKDHSLVESLPLI